MRIVTTRRSRASTSSSPSSSGGADRGSTVSRRQEARASRACECRDGESGPLGQGDGARDADALTGLLADELTIVDHANGITYDRQGSLASFQSMLRVPGLTYRTEHLATLGESLALSRFSVSAAAVTGGRFDVGAYDVERIGLEEVDAQGRRRRAEFFSSDKLGDAIVRLYERYAEMLPDGPKHDRGAMTGRVVAAMMIRGAPFESDMLAPDFSAVDHRRVGYGALQGAREASRAVEAWRDLGADAATASMTCSH